MNGKFKINFEPDRNKKKQNRQMKVLFFYLFCFICYLITVPMPSFGFLS
jgi:hypothetical protein